MKLLAKIKAFDNRGKKYSGPSRKRLKELNEIAEARKSKLKENEKDFINYTKNAFKVLYPFDKFEYNVLSDMTINFTVKNMQVGRIKLRGKIKVQFCIGDNVHWQELEDDSKVQKYIPKWIKYYQSIR